MLIYRIERKSQYSASPLGAFDKVIARHACSTAASPCFQKLSVSCVLDEAFTTAHSIKNAAYRVRALSYIAMEQAHAGMTKEARETLADALTTARSVANGRSRPSSLVDIAKALGNISAPGPTSGMAR